MSSNEKNTPTHDRPISSSPGVPVEKDYDNEQQQQPGLCSIIVAPQKPLSERKKPPVAPQKPLSERKKPPVKLSELSSRGWENPCLTRVSKYHPIGIGIRSVSFGKPFLPTVLDRVRRVLKSLSVHARFQESPVEAWCSSMDLVEFLVAFWESRDDANSVHVEIQRRSGDSITFTQYAQAILSCVEEATQQKASFQKPLFQMASTEISEDAMMKLEEVDSIVDQTMQESQQKQSDVQLGKLNFISKAFKTCNSLMSSALSYDRRMGLDSLCNMVDPYKSGLEVAKICAKVLLRGKLPSEDAAFEQIISRTSLETNRSILLCLALTGSWPDENKGVMCKAEARPEDCKLDPDALLALMIIANAMKLLSFTSDPDAKEILDGLVKEADTIPGLDSGLIDKLLSITQNAESDPHAACFALKALSAACRVIPEVCIRIQSSDSDMSCVTEANRVGVATHVALESESKCLLVALGAAFKKKWKLELSEFELQQLEIKRQELRAFKKKWKEEGGDSDDVTMNTEYMRRKLRGEPTTEKKTEKKGKEEIVERNVAIEKKGSPTGQGYGTR